VGRVGVLYLGRLIEAGSVRRLFEASAHPYTRSLLASVPVISEAEAAVRPREPILEGEIPSPANLPRGCAFHTRCPYAFAPCAERFPEALQLDVDHFVRCHLLTRAEKPARGAHQQLEEGSAR
jgi:peptide/nickel transport system ATP-binding protein